MAEFEAGKFYRTAGGSFALVMEECGRHYPRLLYAWHGPERDPKNCRNIVFPCQKDWEHAEDGFHGPFTGRDAAKDLIEGAFSYEEMAVILNAPPPVFAWRKPTTRERALQL